MKKNFLRCLPFFLLITLILGSCSLHNGKKNAAYVESVKEDVHQAVNLTRELREKQETLDIKNQKNVKECISILDKLSDLYSDLVTLESTDRYDDLDNQLKEYSESALNSVSRMKILLSAAISKDGDKSGYERDKDRIQNDYEETYQNIIDISSEVQTRFRND